MLYRPTLATPLDLSSSHIRHLNEGRNVSTVDTSSIFALQYATYSVGCEERLPSEGQAHLKYPILTQFTCTVYA